VQRFRFLFRESNERNGYQPVGDMLSVSEYRGVVPKEYDHEEFRRTDEELQNYRIVRPGQLAVNAMWLNHLGLGVSDYLGHVSPAYAVYNLSHRLERRFVHHLFRSQYYLKIYLRYLYGIRPNSFQIKTDDWNSIPVIVPPSDTQRAIADFLDRETARIDQLIEKKERLASLASEREMQLVRQAVTQGIEDRPERLTNSRYAWLGSYPNHWQLCKAKHVSKILVPQRNKPELIEDDGLPWVTADYLDHGEISKESTKFRVSIEAATEAGSSIFPSGAVLANCVGQFGLAALAKCDCIPNQQIQGFMCSRDILPEYLLNLVRVSGVYFEAVATLTTIKYVNRLGFANMPILLPPVGEQRKIVYFVRKSQELSNRLVQKNARLNKTPPRVPRRAHHCGRYWPDRRDR
jgi:type I restriction enzyme S subunit